MIQTWQLHPQVQNKKVSDNEQCTRSYQRQETKFLPFESLKVHSNRAQSVILAQGHRVRF